MDIVCSIKNNVLHESQICFAIYQASFFPAAICHWCNPQHQEHNLGWWESWQGFLLLVSSQLLHCHTIGLGISKKCFKGISLIRSKVSIQQTTCHVVPCRGNKLTICCSRLDQNSLKECILCHRKGKTVSSNPVSNGNIKFILSLWVSMLS